MVSRLTVALEAPEYDALFRVAMSELRSPPDQLRYMLRQELAKLGLLPAGDQAAAETENAQGARGQECAPATVKISY